MYRGQKKAAVRIPLHNFSPLRCPKTLGVYNGYLTKAAAWKVTGCRLL